MRESVVGAALVLSFLMNQFACSAEPAKATTPAVDTSRGDKMIAEYFRLETAKLRDACLADIKRLDDWQAKRGKYRRQLQEMLGLDPLPERTPLNAVTTGKVEQDDFVVENIHFQSRPGLYVTGNLYLPKKIEKSLPTILYLCGHGEVKKNNISYGNKVHYQHHGAWFARNGYVCLVIDSLQLGEIEGIHHGTYKYDMWWWLNRGYSPAGVEAWNCMRALDYLETRPEVDKEKFGATGRSGGGAYTWWITALDDRIKCAVPVAGITDLQNHVVDGCVEGHCDCMFFSNTYQWDYPLVAALVAPRPLLIGNTDRDSIFPFDGVVRTFEKVRGVYALYKATDKVGLAMGPGTHKDTPELQVAAFRWFDVHLKGKESAYDKRAVAFFEPEELKVFKDKLPADQINTKIQETFVPVAPSPALPKDKDDWAKMRDGWMTGLKEKTFRAWPKEECPLDLKEVFADTSEDGAIKIYEFTSQAGIRLPLIVQWDAREKPSPVPVSALTVVDSESLLQRKLPRLVGFWFAPDVHPELDQGKSKLAHKQLATAATIKVWIFPRGVGPTAWTPDKKKDLHIRRRFYLLGQSLEAQQIYDVRRAVQAAREIPEVARFRLLGFDQEFEHCGALALYASLFESGVHGINVGNLSSDHDRGPFLLNVNRTFRGLEPVMAMAAERAVVTVMGPASEKDEWNFVDQLSQKMNAGGEEKGIQWTYEKKVAP